MMTIIALCSFFIGVILILIGFFCKFRFKWNSVVILIITGGVFLAFSVLYGMHEWIEYERAQPVEQVQLKPRKASYEGHSYLVFRWNVIHDPNCSCRHPFNRQKEIEK